ncbi:MAG: phosphatase PAP2 family protein [Bacillota bacterium]|nr:phosphatase PAP2 family protein [Bacillota bacterium]
MNFIEAIDLKILDLIKIFLNHPVLDQLLYFLTWIGNKGAVWILISIILLFKKENRKIGIKVIIALLLGLILGDIILKPMIGRIRPFLKYRDITTIIDRIGIYSFPSGHTTSSFAASITIFMNNKKLGRYLIILASGIAFSRLYLMVHYPSDVFGGIILGLICAVLADKLIFKIHKY